MATVAAPLLDHYRAAFRALEDRGALDAPPALAALRRAALERVAARGLPTTRDEDWRYTNLAPLLATPYPPAPAPDGRPAPAPERLALPGLDGPRLVFLDGHFAPALSAAGALPGGGRATSLGQAAGEAQELAARHLGRHADWEGQTFAALNTAFAPDAALVTVEAGAAVTVPVELVFVTTAPGRLAAPRALVVAGPGSRLAVIERHLGLTGGAGLAAPVTEVAVGPGAVVDHSVVQEQGAETVHLATLAATVERDGALTVTGAVFGGRLARTALGVRFAGPGARAALRGLYLVAGRQHVDHHVTVDHAAARCASQQLFKGVLDGRARAVFNGRIIVRPGAQKTDATQTNKHLLLSDGVEVDSKPQLEIFADDVRCTHGAAEGQLGPEALFYLRSRGLAEATARALLTYGFAREVLERVAVEPLQAYLDGRLRARLAGRAEETR